MMSEKENFIELNTEEKLNQLYTQIGKMAKKLDEIIETQEDIGKRLRKIEIVQDNSILDSVIAIASNISDISKKMNNIINLEVLLNDIKSDTKIIKEL